MPRHSSCATDPIRFFSEVVAADSASTLQNFTPPGPAKAPRATAVRAAVAEKVAQGTQGMYPLIDLSRKRMEGPELAHLFANVFPPIETPYELNLSFNPVCGVFDQLIRCLECSRITCIDLFSSGLTDAHCAGLAHVIQGRFTVRKLKIGDNHITATGARVLATALRGTTRIVQLHLGGCPLGDAGVEALLDVLPETAIVSLQLRKVGATHACSAAFIDALPRSRVHELQLRGNALGDKGAINLAVAVSRSMCLRILELRDCGIMEDGAFALLNAVACNPDVKLTALQLCENALRGCGGGDVLRNCVVKATALSHLDLRGCSLANRALHQLLDGLDYGAPLALANLSLENNHVSDGAAVKLARHIAGPSCGLHTLSLRRCQLSSRAVCAVLHAVNDLKALDISSNFGRDAGAAECCVMLQRCPSVTRLVISDNEITRYGVQRLADALATNTTLREFTYGGQSRVPPAANSVPPAAKAAIKTLVGANKRRHADHKKAQGQDSLSDDLELVDSITTVDGVTPEGHSESVSPLIDEELVEGEADATPLATPQVPSSPATAPLVPPTAADPRWYTIQTPFDLPDLFSFVRTDDEA